MKGTIWEDIDDEEVLRKIDKEELESLFGAKVPLLPLPFHFLSFRLLLVLLFIGVVQVAKPLPEKEKVGGKKQVMMLLDPKRFQNISIVLSQFNSLGPPLPQPLFLPPPPPPPPPPLPPRALHLLPPLLLPSSSCSFSPFPSSAS